MTKSNKRYPWLSLFGLFLALTLVMAQSQFVAMAEDSDDVVYDHFITNKYASQHTLGPQGSVTFTVLLYNSGTDTVTADVVDTMPAELTYVTGTANNGGVYNGDDHQISWTGIEVPSTTQVLLTFDAAAQAVVRDAVEVVNTAIVTTNQSVYDTETSVLLLPTQPMDDVEFPVVDSVIIDEGDALTSQEVTLYINAKDNIGVENMMIKEYQVIEKPNSGNTWDVVESSEWVPFEEEYEWTLGDLPGVHFIGVWVADAAGNISHATQEAFDFASYLEQETTITNRIGMIPYAVYYDVGVDVEADLTRISAEGSVNLLVWYPENYDAPAYVAIDPDLDPITFNTPTAGTYLFMVDAQSDVTYNLSISPVGGPSAWHKMPEAGVDENVEVSSLFLLGEIGLDPISQAISDQPGNAPVIPLVPPPSMKKFYLPSVWRR